MELHKRIFDRMKRRKIFQVMQNHLDEILEGFKNDPYTYIDHYERIISLNYLNLYPEEIAHLYTYLLYKLSLSELAGERNVLAYQAKQIEETYRKVPSFLRSDLHFAQLLIDNEERNLFIGNLQEYSAKIGLELEDEIRIYDKLERISEVDEVLEKELREKILKIVLIHPWRVKEFVDTLEHRQPSLGLIFGYLLHETNPSEFERILKGLNNSAT